MLLVCAGDTVVFTDNSHSTDGSDLDCFWMTDMNSLVSNARTFAFVPTEPGEYKVNHIVTNECGCYSEETILISVKGECPVELSCFGAVCANSQGTYTVSKPQFDRYYWTVDGGTLQGANDQNTVSVQWGAPASGFGTLTLYGTHSDCGCDTRKSFQVPVLSDNVPIIGSDTICVGEEAEYRLPLWGSTSYQWNTTGSMTHISPAGSANVVRVKSLQPGSYTLTANFNCSFLHCSYTVHKTIVVKNPMTISASAQQVCVGSLVHFSSSVSSASQWTVMKDNTVIHSLNASSFDYSFETGGIYTVYAHNDNYCNNPSVSIIVNEGPVAPSNIQGPHIACPNSVVTYMCSSTNPNDYIHWEWGSNGNVQSAIGNKVNVTFGSTVSDIRVVRVNGLTGCQSSEVSYPVSPFQLAPWPYNDTIFLCRGQQVQLSDLVDQRDDGVLYDWNVQTNAISIQGSDREPSVTLLANYKEVSSMVNVVLKRQVCNQVRYDNVIVMVGTIKAPQIGYGDLCDGFNSFYIANPNDPDEDSTYWYVDDNYNERAYGSSVYLDLPVHEQSTPTMHTYGASEDHAIHLHYQTKGGCFVDTVFTVTAHSCGPYAAYNDPYYVSNAFEVAKRCNNTICLRNLTSTLSYPFEITISKNYQVIYEGTVYSEQQNILVPRTGTCKISASWNYGNNRYHSSEVVIMDGPIPNYSVSNDCAGHIVVHAPANTRVDLWVDQSTSSSTSPLWASVQYLTVGNSGTASFSVTQSGEYNVRFTPIMGPKNCHVDYPFSYVYGNTPVINQLDVSGQMCKETSFAFSASTTPSDVIYRWDFGDGSYAFGNGVQHAYLTTGNKNVTLTVTDEYGCTANRSARVQVISDNTGSYQIQQVYTPTQPGDSLVLKATPNVFATTYSWRPTELGNSNVANVYKTGTYVVSITTNPAQCHKEISLNVAYPVFPVARIICDSLQCQGDTILLMGGAGLYGYDWDVTRPNGSHLTMNDVSMNLPLIDTGVYNVRLVVHVGNLRDTAYASFYVAPRPMAPVLTFCGNSCITDGPVKVCSNDGRELLWSNGLKGVSMEYYTDDSVSAYYIDPTTGCKSRSGRIKIAEAPNFDGLINGCYRFCEENMPQEVTVYSLEQDGLSLDWYQDNQYRLTTSFSPTAHLPIYGSGEYQLIVPYGNGCRAVSPTLRVEAVDCHDGSSGIIVIEPSVYADKVNVKCDPKGCELYYNVTFRLCNLTDEPIEIGHFIPTSSVVVDVIFPSMGGGAVAYPAGHYVLHGHDCVDVTVKMKYVYDDPTMLQLRIYDTKGKIIGVVENISFRDWLECLNPYHCNHNIMPWLQPRNDISEPYQSMFFDFALTMPTSMNGMDILSVWCDQGEIYYPTQVSNVYSGLLLLDYGLTSQLVVSGIDFCFHVLACFGEKETLCLTDVCIPYAEVWESFQKDKPYGREPEYYYSNGSSQINKEAQQSFTLVPNPATNEVNVIDSQIDVPADNIISIDVLSMQGQKVLSVEGTSQFDVSSLPAGAYIVRVVTDTNQHEYLKLIKR